MMQTLPQPETRRVMVSPAAFNAPRVMTAEVGLSIRQIITRMYDQSNLPAVRRSYDDIIVEIDGLPVARDRWDVIPAVNSHVLIYRKIHGSNSSGGKNPLRTILSLVVVVIAAAATWYAGGAGGWASAGALGLQGAAAAAYGVFAGAVVSTAGMMLVNAIAPVRLDAGLGKDPKDSPTYFLQGARNELRPYQPIPVILGRHRTIPPLAMIPYSELSGNDEYLRMLVIWGYGPLKITDIKIGDTPITAFKEAEIQTREGRPGDATPTLIPRVVKTEAVGVELKYASPIARTAEEGAAEISVDILFPSGIVRLRSSGDRDAATVTGTIESRVAGSGSGWTLRVTWAVSNATTKAVRRSYRWRVADKTKQYEVRVTRSTGDATHKMVTNSFWSTMRSHFDMDPLPFRHPLAMSAIRIKATDQLQGVIDNLSGVCTSYAEVWDGERWGGDVATQNPAALFRLVLKHPANAIPRTDDQIDNDKLGAWYEFCELHGYKFNMVRDYQSSIWDTLADIAAAGRAMPDLSDGVWSVVMDNDDKPVSQHITPRNSWGFSASKTLFTRPHGFRVRFVNEKNDWLSDERIVYADGYNKDSATLLEGMEFPGVTDPDLVWKFGRYHLSQANLRPEEYALYMDFEHLACRMGSKVRVGHDVPLWGSGYGRVKSLEIDGDNTTGVVLDDSVVLIDGRDYVCRFRLADGESLLVPLVNSATETSELMFQTPLLTENGPAVGDLAMFGELNRETVDLLVKRIERSDDFVAKLTLVDVSPAIYEADQGVIPEFESRITRPVELDKVVPPAPWIGLISSGTSALIINNGVVQARMLVNVLMNAEGPVRLGRFIVRFKRHDSTAWDYVDVPVSAPTADCRPVNDGQTYDVQAASVSIYGVQSPWSENANHVVVGQTEPPGDVTGFTCNVVGSEAHLSWDSPGDIDLSYFRIRWSPVKTGATWSASIDVALQVSSPATSVTVPAMMGSYLVKAVDLAGNESETAAIATTAIVAIHDFNFVTDISQATPDWSGVDDGAYYAEEYGGIVLDSAAIVEIEESEGEVWEGYFELDDIVDIGGVYTCRSTGMISARGEDITQDLYDIENLYTLLNLYSSVEGLFSAGIEMRVTNDDPNDDPEWSDWLPFLVGDYTARGYQVRLRLAGTPPNITPVVTAVSVTLDMPDRTVGFEANVGVGGATVSFDPPFFVTPQVGLAILNGQEGDSYAITSLSKSGFDLAFTHNGSPVARSVTGIAKAYGYEEVA